MKARSIQEAEYMVTLGVCPICNSDLKEEVEQHIHVDNPYIRNERSISLGCAEHGDMNDLLSELDFGGIDGEDF